MNQSFLKKISILILIPLAFVHLGCNKAKKPAPKPSQKGKTQSEAKAKTKNNKKAEKTLTYTSDIQPILTKKCVGCHNPNGKVPSVPLDNYDNVSNYIKPNKPYDSQLIQSVDGGSMSGRLNSDEIQKLKTWVSKGAKK